MHLISTGHIKAQLWLGLPIAVGQLGVIVQGFADTMMVGRYTTDALAAGAFVNQILMLVTFLLMGYSYGLTPLVSGAYGRGDARELGGYMKNALADNALYTAFLLAAMAVVYLFLDRFGQDPTILPLARPYFLVILASIPFVMLFNVLRQLTDGTNDTQPAMWALVVSNLLNIVGNYFLIYGIGPFPEMGLMGAGVSTLFSRVFMVLMLGAMIGGSRRYAPYREGFRTARVRLGLMRTVHRMSMPVSLQMGIENAAFLFAGLMSGWIGKVEMASFQVLMTIGTLGFLFYYSFGSAMSIRMATFAGTDDWENAHASMRAGILIQLALATLSSTAFFVFARPLVAFFSEDVRVQAVSLSLIFPLIVYQYADALQIGFASALRGVSQVMAMMRTSVISYIFVCIPMGYLLGFPCGFGVVGIFGAFSLGLGTAAVLYHRSYRRFIARRLPAGA